MISARVISSFTPYNYASHQAKRLWDNNVKRAREFGKGMSGEHQAWRHTYHVTKYENLPLLNIHDNEV